MTERLIFILEIIGTAAFAVSGVQTAVEQKMDILGVLVLAVTTATGGGILRDLVLGITPPSAFTSPLYVEIAIATALIFVSLMVLLKRRRRSLNLTLFNAWMNLLDAAGLGAFSVVGVNVAVNAGYGEHLWLLVFVGAVTGVGGGVIRDVFCGQMPVIFRKRVYAVASIAGAWFYAATLSLLPPSVATLLGVVLVILIRVLATYLHWDLPVVSFDAEQ